MSYCVNCGVELNDSEKKCPLCGTIVLNPNLFGKEESQAIPPYPPREDYLLLSENRRLTLILMTLVFLLPAAVCLLVDSMTSSALSWSYYVAGGMVTMWVFMAPPIFWRKSKGIIGFILLDAAVLLLYLAFVEYLSNPVKPWFISLAFPVVILFTVLVVAFVWAIQSGRYRRTVLTGVFFVQMALGSALLEILIDWYRFEKVSLDWSLITATVFLIVAVFFFVVARKRDLKESLQKKMHI